MITIPNTVIPARYEGLLTYLSSSRNIPQLLSKSVEDDRTASSKRTVACFTHGNYTGKERIVSFIVLDCIRFVRRFYFDNFVSGSSRICQYGDIKTSQKYAVFSSSVFDEESLHYLFSLPLTALTWKRLGFGCLILLIGDPFLCEVKSNVRYVFDVLNEMPHVVLLTIDGVPSNHSVMISQTSRLFGASLVQRVQEDWDETFLITADADIWPLCEGSFRGFFDLSDNTEILHGDIGIVNVTGKLVIHIPLSYVEMKVKTWRDVLTLSGTTEMPKSPDEIMQYFFRVFGNDTLVFVTRGGRGWFMDQFMISLRISEWKSRQVNATQKTKLYSSYFRKERIEPSRNWNTSTIENTIDAHLPRRFYEQEIWQWVRPLIRLIFPDTSTVQWCDSYVETFNNRSDCHSRR